MGTNFLPFFGNSALNMSKSNLDHLFFFLFPKIIALPKNLKLTFFDTDTPPQFFFSFVRNLKFCSLALIVYFKRKACMKKTNNNKKKQQQKNYATEIVQKQVSPDNINKNN